MLLVRCRFFEEAQFLAGMLGGMPGMLQNETGQIVQFENRRPLV